MISNAKGQGKMRQFPAKQRGISLVVMLFMLTIMLMGGLYLIKSSTSATAVTSNLAYDSALSKSADLGLLTAFKWLKDTEMNLPAATPSRKLLLNSNQAANGYVANLVDGQTASASAFWAGSVKLVPAGDNADTIEYVIHRMCANTGVYSGANKCVMTQPTVSTGAKASTGTSLGSDSVPLPDPPRIHYVITSRIFGPRGGNVVNQLIVMVGV